MTIAVARNPSDMLRRHTSLVRQWVPGGGLGGGRVEGVAGYSLVVAGREFAAPRGLRRENSAVLPYGKLS